jgi:hypothetical protein
MGKKRKLKIRIPRCIMAAFRYLREEAQRAKMSRDLGIWVLLLGDGKNINSPHCKRNKNQKTKKGVNQ